MQAIKHTYELPPGAYLVIPINCPETANLFTGPNLFVMQSQIVSQWYLWVLVEKR